jgi:metallo-beta-lactamase family protein
MKITCLGAAGGEVTGSSYLVETASARVLIDCGLFQGGKALDAKNVIDPSVRSAQLDAVLLTHGHLDHVGRLPLLLRQGFKAPIYATPATCDLTGLILRDAAKVQAQDADRRNRRRLRAGEEPVPPLYDADDVEQLCRLLRPAPYRDPVHVAPNLRATWAEAGHMLGSGSIRIESTGDEGHASVVFSGDLGPLGAPILQDFAPFHQADAVFLESTYGDRDHRSFAATVAEFTSIIQAAVKARGKILIPTFAVGRAQLITLLLAKLFREKVVDPFPIFLDSPMAIEATEIYARHPELFDEEMTHFLAEGDIAHDLRTLRATASAEESRAINHAPRPCLVLAGAGMCNAGRILHHLKHNLWQPGTHVIIVGFQSRESLGRRLVEGASEVSIFGEKIAVRAAIHTLGGFSAHAGQTDLLRWLEPLATQRTSVYLTHGENGPRTALSNAIAARHGTAAHLPELGEPLIIAPRH